MLIRALVPTDFRELIERLAPDARQHRFDQLRYHKSTLADGLSYYRPDGRSILFDTEANRRKWVASQEHALVWPIASAMADRVAWQGYDVVGSDEPARR